MHTNKNFILLETPKEEIFSKIHMGDELRLGEEPVGSTILLGPQNEANTRQKRKSKQGIKAIYIAKF